LSRRQSEIIGPAVIRCGYAEAGAVALAVAVSLTSFPGSDFESISGMA